MFGRLKNWLSGPRSAIVALSVLFYVLRQSQLCAEQQIVELAREFESDSGGGIAKADLITNFCRFLIDKNVVTAWQCDKLKAGKYKGFYLDDYVLLEQVGKDYECTIIALGTGEMGQSFV